MIVINKCNNIKNNTIFFKKGGLAEWHCSGFEIHSLPYGSGGSIPSPSAINKKKGVVGKTLSPRLLKQMEKNEFEEKVSSYNGNITNRSASVGEFFYSLIVENGFKNVLEIGSCYGRNTAYMAAACQENGGKAFAIELDKANAQRTKKLSENFGLDNVTVFNCNSFEILAEIMCKNDIQFVFIDACHDFRHSYTEWSISDCFINKEKSMIFFHDVYYRHGDSKGKDPGIPKTVEMTEAKIVKLEKDTIAYVSYGDIIIPEGFVIE